VETDFRDKKRQFLWFSHERVSKTPQLEQVRQAAADWGCARRPLRVAGGCLNANPTKESHMITLACALTRGGRPNGIAWGMHRG